MDVYFCFSFGRRKSEPSVVNHEIATNVLLRLEDEHSKEHRVKPYDELCDTEDIHPHVHSRQAFLRRESIA